MTQAPLEYVRENQERLGLVMLRHCLIVLHRRYRWSPGQTLPKGKDPEMVVEDVIQKYLMGDRSFDPQQSIEAQLKRGVESWLSALHRTKDARSASIEALTEAAGDTHLTSDAPEPDAAAGNMHDTKVLFRLLHATPAVKRHEGLQLLVMAIEDGAEDPKSQSAATGLPLEQIYELRKQLRPAATAVLREFNKGTVPST
jgi:hypothetical protein